MRQTSFDDFRLISFDECGYCRSRRLPARVGDIFRGSLWSFIKAAVALEPSDAPENKRSNDLKKVLLIDDDQRFLQATARVC
jgi:hypothetical protein